MLKDKINRRKWLKGKMLTLKNIIECENNHICVDDELEQSYREEYPDYEIDFSLAVINKAGEKLFTITKIKFNKDANFMYVLEEGSMPEGTFFSEFPSMLKPLYNLMVKKLREGETKNYHATQKETDRKFTDWANRNGGKAK